MFGVNNNGVFGECPKWSIKDGYTLPNINDSTDLLAITHKLISLYKFEFAPRTLEFGYEFQPIESHLIEEVQHLIKVGWVSPRQDNGSYHPTFKGALIMTWKMCRPIKWFINKADVKRSKAALSDA